MSAASKKVIPNVEIEVRLRRPPTAPLLVRFDLCARLGAGGPVVASIKDVHPGRLHAMIATLAQGPDIRDKRKTKVVGIFGDFD